MVNSAITYYFFNHSRKLFSFQIVALTLIACSIFFSPALSPQTKILRFSPARLVTHSVSISLAKLSRSSLRSFVKPVKQICNLSGCWFLGYDGSKGGKYLSRCLIEIISPVSCIIISLFWILFRIKVLTISSFKSKACKCVSWQKFPLHFFLQLCLLCWYI